MAVTNNSLSVQDNFILNDNPPDLTVQDNNLVGSPVFWTLMLNARGYGETVNDVVGLIQMSSKNMGIFYGSAAFSTNNFTTPDITHTTGKKTGLVLPLDANGNVQNDTYSTDYKTRLQLASIFNGYTANGFSINNDYTALLGTNPIGLLLQITGTHAGTYQITGISYGSTTLITVANPPAIFPASGDTIYIIFTMPTMQTVFQYNPPKTKIQKGTNCLKSQLSVNDATDYTKLFPFQTTIATVTRSWSIQCPQLPSNPLANITATSQQVIIGTGTTYNSGANLNSGNYAITLTASFAVNVNANNIITNSVVTSADADMDCNLCLCAMNDCFDKLTRQYDEAVKDDQSRAATLQVDLTKFTSTAIKFLFSQMCAEDTGRYCADLIKILNDNDCHCSHTDTTAVHEIFPLTNVTTMTVNKGMIRFTTSGAGHTPSAADGDIDIYTDTWEVYQSNGSGSWTDIGNIKGAPGAPGAPGNPGAAGANGISVLTNTYPTGAGSWDGAIGTNPCLFGYSYTLAANKLSVAGSHLKIEAFFNVVGGTNTTLAILLDASGSEAVLTSQVVNIPNDEGTTVKLTAILNMVTYASENIDSEALVYPNTLFANIPSPITKDLTASHTINVQSTKSNPVSNNQVQLYQVRITLFND